MGILIAAIVIVALLAIVAVALLARHRSAPAPAPEAEAEAEPMTGLESALEQVTDRSGRPLRDRLDDESVHVDDLRVPDDTGPLLRRALDHVGQPRDDVADPGAAPTEAAGDADGVEGDETGPQH